MTILAILGTALLAAAQDRPVSEGPNLCATDPVPVVRPSMGAPNMEYTLAFPKVTPAVEKFLAGLDRNFFQPGFQIVTPATTWVMVTTNMPSTTPEQVRLEIGMLCGFRRFSRGSLRLVARLDAETLAKRERAQKRLEELRDRPWADSPRIAPISRKELDAFVQRDPRVRVDFFDPEDPTLKLGMVHNHGCSQGRGEERFLQRCTIELPVIQRGEPRYASFRAAFTRDEAGALTYLGPVERKRPPAVPAGAPSASSGKP